MGWSNNGTVAGLTMADVLDACRRLREHPYTTATVARELTPMNRFSCRCDICLTYYFSADDIVAYRVRKHPDDPRKLRNMIEPVALGGREPWVGVRVACRACIRDLKGMQERAGEPIEGRR